MKYSDEKSHIIVFEVEEKPLLNDSGYINRAQIDKIARMLTNIFNSGKKVILVTAGAIASGREKLGLKDKPEGISEKQAIAAIGQVQLIKVYQNQFDQYSQKVAQILLARDILENDDRLNNAKNCFERLIELDVIPIINENDTVSTDDIINENNYPLTASVANIVEADLLVIINGQGFKVHLPYSSTYKFAKNQQQLFSIINLTLERDKLPGKGYRYPLTFEELSAKQQDKTVI